MSDSGINTIFSSTRWLEPCDQALKLVDTPVISNYGHLNTGKEFKVNKELQKWQWTTCTTVVSDNNVTGTYLIIKGIQGGVSARILNNLLALRVHEERAAWMGHPQHVRACRVTRHQTTGSSVQTKVIADKGEPRMPPPWPWPIWPPLNSFWLHHLVPALLALEWHFRCLLACWAARSTLARIWIACLGWSGVHEQS